MKISSLEIFKTSILYKFFLDLFSISHSEGVLRIQTGRSLDREETAVHHLTICAIDSGEPPLNSTVCQAL